MDGGGRPRCPARSGPLVLTPGGCQPRGVFRSCQVRLNLPSDRTADIVRDILRDIFGQDCSGNIRKHRLECRKRSSARGHRCGHWSGHIERPTRG